MPLSDQPKIKKPNARLISIWLCMQKAFSLSSAGQYLVFDSLDLSIETMELFCI